MADQKQFQPAKQELTRKLRHFVRTRLKSPALAHDGKTLAYRRDFPNDQSINAFLDRLQHIEPKSVRLTENALQATYHIAVPLPRLTKHLKGQAP